MDDVLYAWNDSEFWGAKGLGCGLCYVEPAITVLSWGGIGFLCVSRWWPERSEEWILSWFGRQREFYLKFKNRKRDRGRQLVLVSC